jgi:hypothetical protein
MEDNLKKIRRPPISSLFGFVTRNDDKSTKSTTQWATRAGETMGITPISVSPV